MKKEDMYNGMTGIHSEYLEEADAYKPSKRTHWKRWIAAAACLCLLVAGSVSLFPGQKSVSPFVITAYAMEADGEMTGTPIEINQTAPMTKIELPSGMGGFLFSVDLDDKEAESNVYDMCLDPTVHNNIEELYSITEEIGKDYFYFTPNGTEDVDGNIVGITVTSSKTDGSSVAYVLQIINKGGEYTAQLMDVKEYPDGIIGGADGPLSVDTKNRIVCYPAYDPNLPVEENANLEGYVPPKAE